MKKIFRRLWCLIWHGHEFEFNREIITVDGHMYSLFYCRRCGKIKVL